VSFLFDFVLCVLRLFAANPGSVFFLRSMRPFLTDIALATSVAAISVLPLFAPLRGFLFVRIRVHLQFPSTSARTKPSTQFRSHLLSNFTLSGKDVGQIPVITIHPNHAIIASID